MTKWIIIVSGIVTAIVLGFFYWELTQMEPSSSTVATPSSNAITLTHAFKDGVHRYDGELRLPHSCYAVATDIAHNLNNLNNLVLTITTTDNLLEKNFCLHISTSYPFEVITDAPQNVTLTLKVNGVEIPVKLIETAWQAPRGTILNLEN